MSEIKNGGLDQYGAKPFPSNRSNLEQVALKALIQFYSLYFSYLWVRSLLVRVFHWRC